MVFFFWGGVVFLLSSRRSSFGISVYLVFCCSSFFCIFVSLRGWHMASPPPLLAPTSTYYWAAVGAGGASVPVSVRGVGLSRGQSAGYPVLENKKAKLQAALD